LNRQKIGLYPTPIERIEIGQPHSCVLYVKHDDRTSTVYGGNKVRKLEYILARARDRGKKRLLTVGAVGSHHVLATAIHGAAHGFRVHGILVPQPETMHALCNIRAAFAAGLTAEPAIEATLYLHVLAAMDADTEYVSLGGSSVAGSLGYVDAARELEAQVAAGVMPEPDEIVVALGSGGTVAGLLCGLEQTKLATRVLGVSVARPVAVVRFLAERLTRKLAREVGVDAGRALARLTVDAESVGTGYGHATRAGDEALEIGRSFGMTLEPTYTAKAFASALARAGDDTSKKILFWSTLSSTDLSPLLANVSDASLPIEIRKLLRS
jgi:D-cysteine desulfhydrase